jgi:multiple sugar transport system permease protein
MTGVAIRAKASMPAPMPRPAAIVVNGLLAGLAVVALFPLLWMLSVSFMAPGASSVYPPQLWPHEPTLDNYRELFARVGVGRYLANSLFVAVAATALSLFFNVTAG